MKILHTSDWHLGHRLQENSQFPEQKKFLDWLLELIKKDQIDVLIVSGDIYDTGYPSTQSQDLFYNFLARIYKDTDCKEVVMIAGNHDAPGTLNAPDNFIRNFNIRLVGKAPENTGDEILRFDIENESLVIAAVPFLRDRDIRKAIAGEDAAEIETRYKRALIKHYSEIAEIIEKNGTENAFKIATGHLFATGGQTSDSEHRIYVGGLGDIGAEDFPSIFDYIALGHLHRPQVVDGFEHIRYSGSPYPLSFSEAKDKKKVIVIETKNNKLSNIHEIDIPVFRSISCIEGDLQSCIEYIKDMAKQENELEPWVQVILDDQNAVASDHLKVYEATKDLPVRVLNVKRKGIQKTADITKISEEDKQLNELKPEEVFRKKCEEENFDLDNNPEIMDAFYEILNEISH